MFDSPPGTLACSIPATKGLLDNDILMLLVVTFPGLCVGLVVERFALLVTVALRNSLKLSVRGLLNLALKLTRIELNKSYSLSTNFCMRESTASGLESTVT